MNNQEDKVMVNVNTKLPSKQARLKTFGNSITSLEAIRCLAHPDSIDWCNWIADFLEIEADGGDNPGEFVRWCFVEAYKQKSIEGRKSTIELLEKWDGE